MKTFDKSDPKNREREKYWNEDYVAYWKARVEESNNAAAKGSQTLAGDAKTTTDMVYLDAIGLLNVSPSEHVLELGCGFGRSLPILCRAARQVSAVDISAQMIDVARATCVEKNVAFHVSPSEDLPFSDATFDAVVCFAAFDAMYQTEALIEISRVCRNSARVLLTGKNDNYCDDDQAALAAEVGARSKNHPNYFTDVDTLIREVEAFGFTVESQRFYPRRGDFADGVFTEILPARFYEYLLVLRKVSDCRATPGLRIYDLSSKTWRRKESSAL